MNIVRLSDGTEIPVRYCSCVQDTLWIHLPRDLSIAEAAALFADEANMRYISFIVEGSPGHVYEGFTKTVSVAVNEYADEIVTVLKKEA